MIVNFSWWYTQCSGHIWPVQLPTRLFNASVEVIHEIFKPEFTFYSLVTHLTLLAGSGILLAILLIFKLALIAMDPHTHTYLWPRLLCIDFLMPRGVHFDGSDALHKPHSARRFARPRETRRAGSAKEASHLQQCAHWCSGNLNTFERRQFFSPHVDRRPQLTFQNPTTRETERHSPVVLL